MNVKKICRLHRSILFFAALLAAPFLYGDGHIITESSLLYGDMPSHSRTKDIWIGSDKSCSITKNRMTIYRSDLKKKWTLNLKQKKYMEEPLKVAVARTAPVNGKKKKERVQDIGWHYKPVYHWMIKEIEENLEIEGRKCRFIIAEGDADYAEKVYELWVAQELPSQVKDYDKLYRRYIRGDDWEGLCSLLPELKNAFILKSKYTRVNPIAPDLTEDFKVVKIESAAPPPGVYEIPAGFQRVDSKKEFWRK